MKVIVYFLIFFGFGLPNVVSGEPLQSVKIAALLPLSGPVGDSGSDVRRGLQLALIDYQARASNKFMPEIIYEDVQASPKMAVTAYKHLKAQFEIPIIITWGSGVGLALSPIVNKDHTIQIGVATAAKSYSSPDDFTFRNFPSAEEEVLNIAHEISKRFERVGILHVDNDYGISLGNGVSKILNDLGKPPVGVEQLSVGSSDFRSQILKLRSKKPDLIYLAAYPMEGLAVLKQIEESGTGISVWASSALLDNDQIFDLAGPSAEGLWVTVPGPNYLNPSPKLNEFSAAHLKQFGIEFLPSRQLSARAYDTAQIAFAAIEKCLGQSEEIAVCLKRELFKVKNYPGLSGTLSFDRNGDVNAEFHTYRVHNKALTGGA